MDKKKNAGQELGSLKRTKQQNERDQVSNQPNQHKFGIIPVAEKTGDRVKPQLNEIDEEQIIPGLAEKKRRLWNSVDFEKDDFFSGFVPG